MRRLPCGCSATQSRSVFNGEKDDQPRGQDEQRAENDDQRQIGLALLLRRGLGSGARRRDARDRRRRSHRDRCVGCGHTRGRRWVRLRGHRGRGRRRIRLRGHHRRLRSLWSIRTRNGRGGRNSGSLESSALGRGLWLLRGRSLGSLKLIRRRRPGGGTARLLRRLLLRRRHSEDAGKLSRTLRRRGGGSGRLRLRLRLRGLGWRRRRVGPRRRFEKSCELARALRVRSGFGPNSRRSRLLFERRLLRRLQGIRLHEDSRELAGLLLPWWFRRRRRGSRVPRRSLRRSNWFLRSLRGAGLRRKAARRACRLVAGFRLRSCGRLTFLMVLVA